MGQGFYKLSKFVVAPTLRTMWRFRTTGLHHFPETGGAILASNHLSYLDSYFIPSVAPRMVYFVSKAEHFDVPLQRWFFKQWGVIPLRRGDGDNEAFARSLEILREGDYLGLHPEGTRSTDGKLHKGRTGAVRLALMANVPIIPIGIIGTDAILPKGKSLPRLKPHCEIHVGAPMDLSKFAGSENDRKVTRELTDRLMHEIAALSRQEYVDEYLAKSPSHPLGSGTDGNEGAGRS